MPGKARTLLPAATVAAGLLAVGGSWPGPPNAQTVFPARMLVDWVRLYS